MKNLFYKAVQLLSLGLFSDKSYTVEKKKEASNDVVRVIDFMPYDPNVRAAFKKRVAKRRKKNKIARKMRKLNAV